MTPLSDALSRLAAAGRIRSAWLPGMRDTDRGRIIGEDEDGISAPIGPDHERDHWTWTGTSGARWREPDLTDPATLGAIEHGVLAPLGWWIERVLDLPSRSEPDHRIRYNVRHASDPIVSRLHDTIQDALTAALVVAAEATGA